MEIGKVRVDNKVQVDSQQESLSLEKEAAPRFNSEAQTIPSDSPRALAAQVRILPRNNDRHGFINVAGLGRVQMSPEKWEAFQKKVELAVLLAS